MSVNADAAIAKFKTFLGKPRTELPWLGASRIQHFYDCAAGVSYILGIKPEIVSCHVLRDYCIKNGTWTTDLHKVKRGMIVIFDWESKKGLGHNTNTDHVGIVESVDVVHGIVRYISADSGKVIPGVVTENPGISTLWITGFGEPVALDAPTPADPAPIHPIQQATHNTPAPAPTNRITYTVKAGDSYWAIAQAHNSLGGDVVTLTKKLQTLNANKALHPGDVIYLS
jgi:LysM repeat protein